jgi:hypothetical protein
MKISVLSALSLFALLGAQLSLADTPCGTLAGTYTDSDTTGYASRTITRYQQGDSYTYSYQIEVTGMGTPGVKPFDGEVSTMKVVMDGKSALTHGRMSCTTMSSDAIVDGRCLDPSALPYTHISAQLFTYAANGDHLNVWEGQITVLDPKNNQWENATEFRFAEKKFSEMNFQ